MRAGNSTIRVLLIVILLNTSALYPLNENSLTLGGIGSVISDDALDTIQNPASLSWRSKNAGWTAVTAYGLGTLIRFRSNFIGEKYPDGQFTHTGYTGGSWHRGNHSVGFVFGTLGVPVYSSLGLSANNVQFGTFTADVSIKNTEENYSVSTAYAYQINETDSIGFNISYVNYSEIARSAIVIPAFPVSVDSVQTSRIDRFRGGVGYVSRTPTGEIGLILSAPTLNLSETDGTASDSTGNQSNRRIQFYDTADSGIQLGLSEAIMPGVRIVGEVTLPFPMTTRTATLDLEPSNAKRNNIERRVDGGYIILGGLLWQINTQWTVGISYRYTAINRTIISTDADTTDRANTRERIGGNTVSLGGTRIFSSWSLWFSLTGEEILTSSTLVDSSLTSSRDGVAAVSFITAMGARVAF